MDGKEYGYVMNVGVPRESRLGIERLSRMATTKTVSWSTRFTQLHYRLTWMYVAQIHSRALMKCRGNLGEREAAGSVVLDLNS